MIKKLKQIWEALKKLFKKKRSRGRPKGSGKGVLINTPKSQKAKKLLLSRNYNDSQIADIVGLSRERIRQLRNKLGLDVTHIACSPSISEEKIGKILEMSKSYTYAQMSREIGMTVSSIQNCCKKYGINPPRRAWKIAPEVYKAKFESCEGIIREAAKQLGISYICALRYTRALGLKSSYNKKPLDKSSKYDAVRDEVIKELKTGKPLKDICVEKGISLNGFRNHLMYKGVNVRDILDGKKPRHDY
jgi:DNA-binding CsgD family transcriptional regulator